MWQQRRDVQFSPQGIAKALQHNATHDEIAPALFSCLLCGACDVLCPEEIDITGMISALRKEALLQSSNATLKEAVKAHLAQATSDIRIEENTIVLAGEALRSTPATLNKVLTLLSCETSAALAIDDGDDIALALEAGIEISDHRLHAFLEPLQKVKRLYVSNVHLLKQLRHWLPATELFTIGHSLSQLNTLTSKLNKNDLYLIEARAYHLDHKKKVRHYSQLRHERGCHINLDLQCNAIPTAAGGLNAFEPQLDSAEQVRWILSGRNVQRIVAECAEDRRAMSQVSELPVLHIADLMEA